jgi:MFS transporter, PPP family, 3-phenylpropionic acid transporter
MTIGRAAHEDAHARTSMHPRFDPDSTRAATIRFALIYFALSSMFGVYTPYFQKLLALQGFDEQEIGFIFGMLETCGIVSPPLWGWISDRGRHRRRIIAGAALGTMLCFLSFGWISHFALGLLAGGGFGFFFRAMTPLIDGMVLRYISEHGGDFGRMRLTASFAFIASILFLEFVGVSGGGARGIILATGGVCLFLTALAAGALPLTAREKAERANGGAAVRRFDASVFRSRPFLMITLAAFLVNFSMVGHYNFFTLFVQKEFHFQAAGYIWVIGPMAEILVVFFSSEIIAKIGVRGMFALGPIATALRLGGYAVAPSVGWIMGLQVLHSFAYGATYFASVNYINRLVPVDMKQSAMAVFISLSIGAAGIAGGSIGGSLIHYLGYRTMFASYAAVAVVSLLVLVFLVPKPPEGASAACVRPENAVPVIEK